MLANKDDFLIFIISDFTGKTAETVINSVGIQFNLKEIKTKKFTSVSEIDQLSTIIDKAKKKDNVILAYTLVLPELCDYIEAEARKYSIPTIDIMGPLINKFSQILNQQPRLEVGLSYEIDQELYQRVNSINFSSKYDEGKNLNKLKEADYVLIGVSRTSKTPLSIYLANKNYKVANFSLSANMIPPQELYQLSKEKIIGLTIDAKLLQKIRQNRIELMEFDYEIDYIKLDKIKQELSNAQKIMKDLECKIIDISHKAIEEIAMQILE